ncbi:T9SS type A sorting domain-containing protein [bacterium]|nr:T9SS type A sorting domain-containing protein [bacterium]
MNKSFNIIIIVCTILVIQVYALDFGAPQPASVLKGVSLQTGNQIGARMSSMQITVNKEDFKILDNVYENYDAVVLDGYNTSGKDGVPELITIAYRFVLPKNSVIRSAELIGVQTVKVSSTANIIPARNPRPILQGYDYEPVPDPAVYNVNAFYPRCPLEVQYGHSNMNTIARVYLKPSIYNPMTGEIYLITEGEIRLSYDVISNAKSATTDDPTIQNILITSEELLYYAEELAAIHESYGVHTVVITTEYIDEHYYPVPYPEIPGLLDTFPDYEFNYDSLLAARIVTFLLDARTFYSEAKSITLFGDSDIIPPSFYFYLDAYYTSVEYWKWHPMDFFYASPDFDMIRDYAVGRIPVGDRLEAGRYLNKVRRFNSNASSTWFLNALGLGGDTFSTNKHDGELTIGYAVNEDWLDNFTVEKLYATKENYDLTTLMNRLATREYGFLMLVGHGGGDSFAFDSWPSFTVTNLLMSGHKQKLPVYLFMNCLNGTFDEEILPTEIHYDMSLCEAVVLEDEGGIAAVGATRVSFGGTRAYFSWGEIYWGYPSMAFLQGVLFAKQYNKGIYNVGDIWNASWEEYLDYIPFRSIYDTVFYWETSLFGDPAMVFPDIPGHTNLDTIPDLSLSEVDFGNRSGYAIINGHDEVTFNIDDCHSDFQGRLYDLSSDDLLSNHEYSFLTHNVSHRDLDVGSQYLYIIENETGKEDRAQFLWTNDAILINGSFSDWDTILPYIQGGKTGDYDPERYKLDSIWIGDDDNNWYIAFNLNHSNSQQRGYGISFGYTYWGYTGTEGETTIPDDLYLTFSEEHPVWSILFLKYHPYDAHYCWWEDNFYFWDETEFANSRSLADLGGDACFNVDNAICEVKVPKSTFSYSDTIYVSLFSYYIERGDDDPEDTIFYPTQDVLPYHPEVDGTENTTAEDAYTITRFYKYYTGYTDIDESNPTVPKQLSIYAYPNPFNSTLTIKYNMPTDGEYDISLYNILGDHVETIEHGIKPSGTYTTKHNSDDLGSGIYFIKFKTQYNTSLNKILLLK